MWVNIIPRKAWWLFARYSILAAIEQKQLQGKISKIDIAEDAEWTSFEMTFWLPWITVTVSGHEIRKALQVNSVPFAGAQTIEKKAMWHDSKANESKN